MEDSWEESWENTDFDVDVSKRIDIMKKLEEQKLVEEADMVFAEELFSASNKPIDLALVEPIKFTNTKNLGCSKKETCSKKNCCKKAFTNPKVEKEKEKQKEQKRLKEMKKLHAEVYGEADEEEDEYDAQYGYLEELH